MQQSLTLDRMRPVAQQLYEALRQRILSMDLSPGMHLSRAELAQQHGVSQTPVRDALMRLQAEGLVDVFPQAATQVSKISLSHARRTHFLRRAIELELVREHALKPDASLVARLRAALVLQTGLSEADDREGFVGADQSFHAEFYRAAGQEELLQLVHSRSGHIDRLRRLHMPTEGKMQRILEDHQRIVDGIAKGDPDQACQALREHLSGTLQSAQEIRQLYPDSFVD